MPNPKRFVFLGLGFISLGIGVLGIFLPLLPATPFLILSSFCFARSNPSFHNWLLNHRVVGSPIRDWEERGIIQLKNKIVATLMLMASGAYIFSAANISEAGKMGFGAIALIVSLFIWTRPVKR